jgi:hypothetical protein
LFEFRISCFEFVVAFSAHLQKSPKSVRRGTLRMLRRRRPYII